MNLLLTKSWRPLLIGLAIFFPLFGLCQQGNNWYFGYNAGLSFNSATPTPLTDGALATDEGCATISDSTGHLLFYTDGIKVYNRQHEVMANGADLMGHPSSSHSAIVVPQPGSNFLYYIFTADAVEHDLKNGYRYSIVDMRLNDGLGDVVQKNFLLYAKNTEKLAAVGHANGSDIWIVTIEFGGNSFKVFKLGCNGLDPTPVVSQVGLTYELFQEKEYVQAVGCIKASPDNKKLATVRLMKNGWELFDFDNNTGVVSNPLFIPTSTLNPFGIEFSPNSQLVYVGSECCEFRLTVLQYKIDVYDSTTIVKSRFVVDSSIGEKSALQLGPDNKIYSGNSIYFDDSSINVIHNPDVYGAGCNYQYKAINLGEGRRVTRCFPTFYKGVISNPNVDFIATPSQDCKTVNFTASTVITGPLTWRWDFGDGTTAIGPNVSHQFSDIGDDFHVTVTVENTTKCGAKAFKMKIISFHRPVIAAGFSAQAGCGRKTVQFEDSSIVTNGSPAGWLWEFGDGQTSTEKNPVHAYAAFGSYRVRLTIVSNDVCGTKDTLSQLITIQEKPLAAFAHTAACTEAAVKFQDTSVFSNDKITAWYWDFGNGQFSSEQNPVVSYKQPGSFSIRFAVRSANGCVSDTLTKELIVGSKPVAGFSVSGLCAASPTSFRDSSFTASGAITNWYWNLGNGSVSSSPSPVVIYSAGTYAVKMVCSSAAGCTSDTVTKTFSVDAKPIVDFTYTSDCGSKNVSFVSTVVPSTPATQHWEFGDNRSTNLSNGAHSYGSFGTYVVRFAVTTALGCASDTIIKMIEVRAKPRAEFSTRGDCENALTSFQNKTTLEAGTIASYLWSFGEGVESSQTDTTIRFTKYGDYAAQLIAVSDKNCTDTIRKTVSIDAKPIADFSAESGCQGKVLNLQNKTSTIHGTLAEQYWDFGNGVVVNTDRPAYAYPAYGNYAIKHVAVTQNGCVSDTVMKEVVIESLPTINFSFGNTCAGKEVKFINSSSNDFGAVATWRWAFGDGVISSEFEPTYTYYRFGIFPISLTAATSNGCTSRGEKSINISQVTVNAGGDTIAVVGQPIQLHATGASTYEWNPGTGLNFANVGDPTAILAKDQIYYLKGITTEGCIGYDTLLVKVFAKADVFVPNAFTPNGDGKNDEIGPVCAGIKSLQRFVIYNRWGQLIFSTVQMSGRWNGKVSGKLQETGTYVWAVKATGYDGKSIERKGTLTLIQ